MIHHSRSTIHDPRSAAFTLVELVIVLVILGIIAAITVPKFGQASEKARAKSVAATLQAINAATQQYFHDHDAYPGCDQGGVCDNGAFTSQISMFTDKKGNYSASPSTQFNLGPYFGSQGTGVEKKTASDKPFPPNPYYNLTGNSNRRNDVWPYATPTRAVDHWGPHTESTHNLGWIFDYTNGNLNIYLGANPAIPAPDTDPSPDDTSSKISLSQLIMLAAPAPIDFNHPALH
ncbi:MAG: hypothetical protein HJJLKODD_00766 [Phycisphaerae bacterium]|nr:hypothetical protein [Phycisphaerae bacterium]